MPARRSSLSQNQKLTLLVAILTAGLAAGAAILAAFISGHDWFGAPSSSAAVSTAPTPFSGDIELAAPGDPGALSPGLEWDPGSSAVSTYALEGRSLAVIAGPHTWPNFPMITFDQPLSGDFSVQVRVMFAPGASVLETAEMAGLLVRPANDHMVRSDTSFPDDWAVAGKSITDAGILVGCRGSWLEHSPDGVFLKLERVADSWKCGYSDNGENWSYLEAGVNDAGLRDRPLSISLFAYSDTDNAIRVEFSDWRLDRY